MAVIILQVGRPHCKEPLADCTGHVIVNMVMLLATMMRLPQAVLIYILCMQIIGPTTSLVHQMPTGTTTRWLLWPLSKSLVNVPSTELFWDDGHVLILARFGANMCYHPTGYVICGIHVWKLPCGDRWVCFLQNYFWYNGKPNGTTNNGRRKAFEIFGD